MRRLVTVAIASAVLLAACGAAASVESVSPDESVEPVRQSPEDQTPSERPNGGLPPETHGEVPAAAEAPLAVMVVDGVARWADDFAVQLDNGWQVAPCEGDAPMWCVSGGGEHVGAIELLAYPLAADAASLHVRAAAFLEDMRDDRATGCAGAEFVAAEPVDVLVGGGEGIRFGFSLTRSGVVIERHVLYWSVVDGYHVTINAGAYADDGCMERLGEFLPADLAVVVGAVDQLVAHATLPDLAEAAGVR